MATAFIEAAIVLLLTKLTFVPTVTVAHSLHTDPVIRASGRQASDYAATGAGPARLAFTLAIGSASAVSTAVLDLTLVSWHGTVPPLPTREADAGTVGN